MFSLQHNTENRTPSLHLRVDGRSEELELAALDLSLQSPDDQLKRAAERWCNLPQGYLDSFQVARHSTTIVIRPEAIYG